MATVLEDTHTTAVRSSRDPEKVINLTLTSDYLHIEMVGFEDRVQKVATSENRAVEAKEELKSQWQVVSLKALEKLNGPFHVGRLGRNRRWRDGRHSAGSPVNQASTIGRTEEAAPAVQSRLLRSDLSSWVEAADFLRTG